MSTEYTPDFVARLRDLLRAEYGNIRRVSDTTGITYGTLKQFAAGRGISVAKMDQIARALGHRIVLSNERDPHTKGGSDE